MSQSRINDWTRLDLGSFCPLRAMFVCLTLPVIYPKATAPSAPLAAQCSFFRSHIQKRYHAHEDWSPRAAHLPALTPSVPAAAHSDLSHQHMQRLQDSLAIFALNEEVNRRHSTSNSEPLSLPTLIQLHFAQLLLSNPQTIKKTKPKYNSETKWEISPPNLVKIWQILFPDQSTPLPN